MDRRTYFPGTHEEILAWQPGELTQQIDRLYALGGNNQYYDPGVRVDQENLRIEGTVLNDPFSTGDLWRTRQFIREYNPDPRIY
jgi:hypothetical protein